MTCVVCDKRPARNGGLCANCNAQIESGKRKSKAEQPVKYATYKGHVIGFYRNGGGNLVARLVRRNPDNLPKSITLDLNTYIEGFDRTQIKKIKSAILTLSNA